MLENKVIVYDDSCPMCRAYTSGFVRLGILQPQNRVGFARASHNIVCHLDLTRARHEIPLVDLQTGVVTYGIDTLFMVIEHRYPAFNRMFKSARFRTAIYGLYQLVTYNRRVIAGCAPPHDGLDCAPDFHRGARLRYLKLAMFMWLLIVGSVVRLHIVQHRSLLAALAIAVTCLQLGCMASAKRSASPWDRCAGIATNGLMCALLLAPWAGMRSTVLAMLGTTVAVVLTAADGVRRHRNMA